MLITNISISDLYRDCKKKVAQLLFLYNKNTIYTPFNHTQTPRDGLDIKV